MSRGGVQGFQKDRLAQILAARRLNQTQLASMVGVSPATISKWRSGSQIPEHAAVERLANVVNVSPEWFTKPLLESISPPLFRSNASAHVAARSMLKVRLEWAQDIAAALAEYVDYPEVNLPEYKFSFAEEITFEDIESAACQCRDLWHLGRTVIQDLALAVEGAGIILVREETGIPQIEGLSAWSYSLERPAILLSADKANGYRGRFDLAHELGHLILHRYIQHSNAPEQHKLLEKQAHYFAGAFLLPAESFAAEVRLPTALDDLLLLKRRWGVSVAAIIMRLKALELLDDENATALFKRRSARWGAKSEPGDQNRAPEQPRLLRRSIDLLKNEGVMPLESIPRHIGLASSDIEMLAGLPEGYFESSQDNIVHFAQLRKPIPTNKNQTSHEQAAVLSFKKPEQK